MRQLRALLALIVLAIPASVYAQASGVIRPAERPLDGGCSDSTAPSRGGLAGALLTCGDGTIYVRGSSDWVKVGSGGNPFDQSLNTTDSPTFRTTTAETTREAFAAPTNLVVEAVLTDGSLAAGTYYFVVVAEDLTGGLSLQSNEVSATVSMMDDGTGDVQLNFDYQSGSSAANYRIYYGSTPGGEDHYVYASHNYLNPSYFWDPGGLQGSYAGVPPVATTFQGTGLIDQALVSIQPTRAPAYTLVDPSVPPHPAWANMYIPADVFGSVAPRFRLVGDYTGYGGLEIQGVSPSSGDGAVYSPITLTAMISNEDVLASQAGVLIDVHQNSSPMSGNIDGAVRGVKLLAISNDDSMGWGRGTAIVEQNNGYADSVQAFGVNTLAPAALLHVYNNPPNAAWPDFPAAAQVVSLFEGRSDQTGDLIQAKKNGGSLLFRVGADGKLYSDQLKAPSGQHCNLRIDDAGLISTTSCS